MSEEKRVTLTLKEIRALRIASGISQKDFADLMELPVGSWSNLEVGRNKKPGLEQEKMLQKATKIFDDLGVLDNIQIIQKARELIQEDRQFEDARKMRYGKQEKKEKMVEEVKQVVEEDVINKPSHYHKGGIDVIEYMQHKVSQEALEGFYQINIIKYVTRYKEKGGLEDLLKAEFYLKKLIELQEG